MSDDEEEIAKFIAEKGVKKCPPQAAAIMGESRPGRWRNAERMAENRGGRAERKHNDKLRRRYARPLP